MRHESSVLETHIHHLPYFFLVCFFTFKLLQKTSEYYCISFRWRLAGRSLLTYLFSKLMFRIFFKLTDLTCGASGRYSYSVIHQKIYKYLCIVKFKSGLAESCFSLGDIFILPYQNKILSCKYRILNSFIRMKL